MAYYKKLPDNLKSIGDFKAYLQKKLNKFREKIKVNPETIKYDAVYYFRASVEIDLEEVDYSNRNTCFEPLDPSNFIEPSGVIAGSAALCELVNCFKPAGWRPNDTDFFLLKCATDARTKVGTLDMVQRKVGTVADLLYSFDLPCCRVAMFNGHTFLASQQALFAIISGQYYLPEIYRNQKQLEKYLDQEEEFPGSYTAKEAAQFFVQKHYERVVKYNNRGFKANYIKNIDYFPFVNWIWYQAGGSSCAETINNPRQYFSEYRLVNLDNVTSLVSIEGVRNYLLDKEKTFGFKLSDRLKRELEEVIERQKAQESLKKGNMAVARIRDRLQVKKASKDESSEDDEPTKCGSGDESETEDNAPCGLAALMARKAEEKQDIIVASLGRNPVKVPAAASPGKSVANKPEIKAPAPAKVEATTPTEPVTGKQTTAIACNCTLFEEQEKTVYVEMRKLVCDDLKLNAQALRIALLTKLARLDEIALLRSLSKD
jgi:hypothetical protein